MTNFRHITSPLTIVFYVSIKMDYDKTNCKKQPVLNWFHIIEAFVFLFTYGIFVRWQRFHVTNYTCVFSTSTRLFSKRKVENNYPGYYWCFQNWVGFLRFLTYAKNHILLYLYVTFPWKQLWVCPLWLEHHILFLKNKIIRGILIFDLPIFGCSTKNR